MSQNVEIVRRSIGRCETWAQTHWDVERIFEGDGVLVSFYRSISTGRASGIEVVRDLTGVHHIREAWARATAASSTATRLSGPPG